MNFGNGYKGLFLKNAYSGKANIKDFALEIIGNNFIIKNIINYIILINGLIYNCPNRYLKFIL